jgi:DNA-binding ferritin-like protein
MKDCIAMARMMNLFYHHLHNIASGVAFEGDHEMMLEFYEALDDAYDSLIERHIGLGGSMGKADLCEIIENAEEVLDMAPDSVDMLVNLQHAMGLEIGFRAFLQDVNMSASLGTQNLVQDQCDKSEIRSYKLSRRVK